MPFSGDTLAQLYDLRFGPPQSDPRSALWRVLVQQRLQRYVRERDAVLDYGAGACGFINHIRASSKVAVDLDPRLAERAGPHVQAIVGGTERLATFPPGAFDVIFSSNVLEHLESRTDLLALLSAFRALLAPGGHLILIGPNYRYAFREYWDFFDHKLPLSDRSLAEGLALAGFDVQEQIARFLPFTTKGRPLNGHLLRLFLALPQFVRNPFGGQFFLVARPATPGAAEAR